MYPPCTDISVGEATTGIWIATVGEWKHLQIG